MPILAIILLSGCMGDDAIMEMGCRSSGPATPYEWGDGHQWNAAPMSYGNSTLFEINNSSDGVLIVNITVSAYFSESNEVLDQGYFNLTIFENETILWTNQTSSDGEWNLDLNITGNETVRVEIRASGKDEHPESDYGDFFVVMVLAETNPPIICS